MEIDRHRQTDSHGETLTLLDSLVTTNQIHQSPRPAMATSQPTNPTFATQKSEQMESTEGIYIHETVETVRKIHPSRKCEKPKEKPENERRKPMRDAQ